MGSARYGPELEQRLRRRLKPTNKSWRVDETYIRVKGRWCYLYRAIDSTGAAIDFLLSALRDGAAAKQLFRKALSDPSHPQPRVINTDQARLYGSAIPGVKEEGILRRRCRHRPVQYLNNILEQDHRAIKRRAKAKQNFREFQAARRTIEGYEAMHMIRKGQARWLSGKDVRKQNQFIDKLFDLPVLTPRYSVHLGAIPLAIFKVATLPKPQTPQAADHDFAAARAQQAYEFPAARIESSNLAAAKVAHQKIMAERPEICNVLCVA